jgi:DNA-binding beta-propeller fold protein YncE
MTPVRPRLLPGALLLAALLLAVALPAAASAAQAHKFSTAFGAPGAGAGQLALVFPALSAQNKPITAGSGVAVDDETGDVYVADTGNHRVSEFTSTGTPLRAFGADVGGAGVDVCTATCLAGTSGSAPGQLGTPTFIAVDNSAGPSHGDVYVADSADNVISKFDAAGALVTSWGTGGQLDGSSAEEGPFAQLDGIAVDPAGNLWVQGNAEVFEFTQAGAFVRNWTSTLGTQPTGIALDGAEHIYLLDGFERGPIHRFSTSGTDLGAVYGPAGTYFSGLTADQAHNDLYVDEEGASIGDLSPRCEPSAGECSPVQVFGEGDLHAGAGLAIDSATGTLYAASTADDQITVFPVAIEATIAAPTEVKATTATLHGEVNPEGSLLSRCIFEYGEGSAEGHAGVPCETEHGEPLDGNTPIAVHADVSGLSGGTPYAFRLRATNAAGDVKSEEEELHTLALPTIEVAEATEITADTAVLKAEINPHGLATTCELQYGTSSAYGTTIPCEPATLGSGTSPVPVSASLQGLSPATTYHFRFLAGSPNGTATGPDQTFVFLTGPEVEQGCSNQALREENGSTALPDCRAYELVTPAGKNGALIDALFAGNVKPQISDDGSTVIAPSIQCFAGTPGCTASRQTEGALYGFSRTAAGWMTTPLSPPASVFQTSSWWNFNPATQVALYGVPNANGGDDFYAGSGGSYTDIGPFGEGETSFNRIKETTITADLSHVVYGIGGESVGAAASPWSFDHSPASVPHLYEYVGRDNTSPLLVGVSGGHESTDLIGICGTTSPTDGFEPLSRDGHTVFFQTQPCASGSGANAAKPVPVEELFARIDGEGPGAHTVSISEPDALEPVPPNEACTTTTCIANTSQATNFRDGAFEGASGDGSRVFFSSTQQLTDEASQDPTKTDTAHSEGGGSSGCFVTTGPNGCNLYLYDSAAPAGRHLIDVSAGAGASGGPRVQGAVAISPDGSHVYFVAKGVLTETPDAEGKSAVEGAENLYLYERDATDPAGSLTFVSALAESDDLWRGHFGGEQGVGLANVTPDGRYLVFPSRLGLTPDARSGEGPAQIYRYDAQTGALDRISIGRRGFNDDGDAANADASIRKPNTGEGLGTGKVRTDPTMSDDGRYVFFESPVALTPRALDEVQVGTDVNGSVLAQNIYEWEAEGTGGCGESSGCVSLLSDGTEALEGTSTGPTSPELLGTDASGEDVFIAAADPLTWADTDTQRDFYDLRVGGGFPKPAEPPVCLSDACKGPGTQAGAKQNLATPDFSGPSEGPKTPPKTNCKKGFVKRGGKCVKKRPAKKGRHKSKKKGQKKHKRAADSDRRAEK